MALTGTQRDAVALAIARGQNVKTAAKETGVGLRTLHRWLAEDPAFRQRVNELREGLFSQAAGRLSDLAGQATETLGGLLRSEDEKVRLQAARIIFEAAGNFRQMTEVSARLATLEQQAKERNDTWRLNSPTTHPPGEATTRSTAAEIPIPVLNQQGELAALAPKLAQYLRARVENYKEYLGLTPQEAVAKATAPCPNAENSIGSVPPELLSWGDLETLYRSDPATALEKWVQTREAARDELQSGARAASAVQPDASLWWLARFLAVRDELAAEWQPRDGCERLLVDQAAQAHTLLLFWQEEVNARTALVTLGGRREVGREQPRVDDRQAMEMAMGMVERYHAMFARTAKTLGDLRRGRPAVVVGRAGQVNFAQQLVNLNTAKG